VEASPDLAVPHRKRALVQGIVGTLGGFGNYICARSYAEQYVTLTDWGEVVSRKVHLSRISGGRGSHERHSATDSISFALAFPGYLTILSVSDVNILAPVYSTTVGIKKF